MNRLLRQLEQSRKLMKMMSGKGRQKAKRMGFPVGSRRDARYDNTGFSAGRKKYRKQSV